MPDYKTPLPRLFAASLEAAITRVLDLDPNTKRHLKPVAGRLVQLDIEGLELRLFFEFERTGIAVKLEADRESDTLVKGSPGALFAMALPDDMQHWDKSGSRVHISGDATLARELERIFRKLDPDWEAPFTRVFGDVLGHQLARGLHRSSQFALKTAKSTGDMISDYLTEESKVLVHPVEMQNFVDEVDDLRDDVERLEARIRKLD